VGRIIVAFTKAFEATEKVDLSKYHNLTTQTLTATTNQLKWKYGKQPFVTLDTPESKAVIGFSEAKKQDFDELSITTKTPFAVVLITALEKDKTLKTSKKWLITAVAKARNTGMKYSDDGTQLLEKGTAPLLLEPVDFTLNLKRKGKAVLHVLDHDGLPTKESQRFDNQEIIIEGSRWKTMYYTVGFEK